MLSCQTEKKATTEVLPKPSTRADLSRAISTNPKAISRLLSAAIVDRSFQKLLLTRPELAMANGYNGENFDLTDDDRALILTIRASSIKDFAAQLVRLRENNCSGEWVIRGKRSEANTYAMPMAVEPAWNLATLPTR